jgi:hypothetical protein
MYSDAKSFLKAYSIIVVSIVGVRMFFNKKPNTLSFAALVPTIIYLFNV